MALDILEAIPTSSCTGSGISEISHQLNAQRVTVSQIKGRSNKITSLQKLISNKTQGSS